MVTHRFIPQVLDTNEDAKSVADFFNTHLFQDVLVAFDKIATSNIIH